MDGFRAFVFGMSTLYIVLFLALFAIYVYPVLNVVVGGPAPFPITWLMIVGYILWVIPGLPIFIVALVGFFWSLIPD